MGGYKALKSHVFFKDVNWDELHKEQPPKLPPLSAGHQQRGHSPSQQLLCKLCAWFEGDMQIDMWGLELL